VRRGPRPGELEGHGRCLRRRDQNTEQYIHRIRLRIEPDPSRPQTLLTVRGYGYMLSIA